MRLKKGSKVEILDNTQGFGAEWHCAHIVCGNGHSYKVQYDDIGKAKNNRVSRKAIRPCPPSIANIGCWKVNEIVEVYIAGSWKEATVLKYVSGDFYLVRLRGSNMELKVHKDDTRICQSWKNGQWIISPMGPAKSGVLKFSRNLISNNYKRMPEVQQAKNVCSPGLDASCIHLPSPPTLKRSSSHGSSHIEDYPRKKRAVLISETERLKAVSTAPSLEKVDAIAYPQNNMGEKYMHYSFINSTNQFYETRKENPCNITTLFPETIREPDYSCSNLSSVGSCSVLSGRGNEFFGDTLAGPCQSDEDTLRSDADSLDIEDANGFFCDRLAGVCESDEETCCSDAESLDVEDVDEGCTILPKEVVTKRIHRASVGGLHALLPMAKYDTRFASFSLCKLIGDIYH
ncbi:uncharacterized protein [Cicer arietinum]|uniref:Uncharacterized protein LOC101515344 isoform X2 n=1 Tax=Cicer arietinum TaxID=3827 RepID=A0A3Q7YFF1_CICAR|nr:uncharacterized protein LOC101515344 isoform X2 [Cicer arietinum]